MLKKSGAFLFIVVVCLLATELMLAAVSAKSPRIRHLLAKSQNTEKDARLGWRPSPTHPEHDSKGFRNARVPSEAAIVAMGDSQTYGVGVTPEDAWPQQLTRLLGDRICYNMAYGGYGPMHSLLLLEEAMAMQPKLIIEAFYTGNDLHDAYNLVYESDSLKDYRSSDVQVLKQLESAQAQEPLSEKIRQYQWWVRKKDSKKIKQRSSSLVVFLSQYSKAWGLLRAIKRRITPQEVPREGTWEEEVQAANAHGNFYRFLQEGSMKTILTPEYRLTALDLQDPRILEGLRLSHEAIAAMNRKAQAAGIDFAVLMIPTKELACYELASDGLLQDTVYKQLIEHEQRIWSQTLAFLGEQGIPVIDALPALRDSVRREKLPYHASRDGHADSLGQYILAQEVRKKLMR